MTNCMEAIKILLVSYFRGCHEVTGGVRRDGKLPPAFCFGGRDPNFFILIPIRNVPKNRSKIVTHMRFLSDFLVDISIGISIIYSSVAVFCASMTHRSIKALPSPGTAPLTIMWLVCANTRCHSSLFFASFFSCVCQPFSAILLRMPLANILTINSF